MKTHIFLFTLMAAVLAASAVEAQQQLAGSVGANAYLGTVGGPSNAVVGVIGAGGALVGATGGGVIVGGQLSGASYGAGASNQPLASTAIAGGMPASGRWPIQGPVGGAQTPGAAPIQAQGMRTFARGTYAQSMASGTRAPAQRQALTTTNVGMGGAPATTDWAGHYGNFYFGNGFSGNTYRRYGSGYFGNGFYGNYSNRANGFIPSGYNGNGWHPGPQSGFVPSGVNGGGWVPTGYNGNAFMPSLANPNGFIPSGFNGNGG